MTEIEWWDYDDAAELADAVERSLGIVPRLLRGPIKKVLGL